MRPAQFLLSRARRLFQYNDLDSSEGGDTMTRTTTTPLTRRKKMVVVVAAVCSLALIIVIGSASVGRNRPLERPHLPPPPERQTSSSAHLLPVQLRDIVYGKFRPRTFNGTWISDTEIMHASSIGGIKVLNVEDNSLSYEVMSASKVLALHALEWFMSADKRYLLLKRTSHPIYRRSSYGAYSIVELKTSNGRSGSSIVDLKPPHVLPSKMTSEGFMIRYVAWSPVGNGIAYVGYDNNLYVRRSARARDEQLTADGEPGSVFNGVPDWVFEEEVFEDNFALWWSPDSTKIVWGSFNDTEVQSYFLPFYGPPSPLPALQYPAMKQLRYPKVGTANPSITLWLADLSKASDGFDKMAVAPPAAFRGQEAHFTWVTWADADNFAVTWMNRVQDHTIVSLCHVSGLDCSSKESQILEHQQENGWIDYKYRIHFNPNPPNPTTKDFVVILPANFVKHHYRQLVHVSGGGRTFLTKAEADVTQILSWTRDGYIYYLSTMPGEPGSRHIYRIVEPGSISSTQPVGPECLTCRGSADVDKTNKYLGRKKCSYYSANMSKHGKYFTMNCHGPSIPWTCIHETRSGRLMSVYEDNKRLESKLFRYSIPRVLRMKVPVSNSDQSASVKMYLPPDFDPQQKYPMLVYTYGGPGSQQADDKWSQHEYQTYASSNQGIVYAIIDPKGSGFQGDDWMFKLYKSFGTAEVDSTIEIVRYLQENLPYVSKAKTAIWGWSYGGFLSLSVLSRDVEGVFACGASVAPVTDWTLYDTYYTERYMGLPEDNVVAYNRSSIFHHLENLRNKKYLVMHGTHDDNVHLQQSLLLAAALESKDILFRQQLYPDQDHTIFRYHQHLYHSLTDFFVNDCFA